DAQRAGEGRRRAVNYGLEIRRRLGCDGERVFGAVLSCDILLRSGGVSLRGWRLFGRQVREHLSDMRELDADLLVERVDLVHIRIAARVVEQLFALFEHELG